MQFVKEAQIKLDEVRSKPWAPPVATALEITGEAVNAVGSWLPGVGMIGGALKMGGRCSHYLNILLFAVCRKCPLMRGFENYLFSELLCK